jgi:hypothetical protein
VLKEFSQEKAEEVFDEKEVLLKVITLRDNTDEMRKIDLIESISNATNRQTPVINADKYSNESIHLQLQKKLFEKYGILYERKRGEFEDGLYNKYISENQIVERNLLLRIYYAANGNIQLGIQKKLFQNNRIPNNVLTDEIALDKMFIGLNVFDHIWDRKQPYKKASHAEYAKVYLFTQYLYNEQVGVNDIEPKIDDLEKIWKEFVLYTKTKLYQKKIKKRDRVTGEMIEVTKVFKYNYKNIANDLREFMKERKSITIAST